MKELSIEEKAKRYDELIKRLNKAREDVSGYTFKSVYDEVMSELKESEDEKIRKEIISALKYANCKGVYDKHLAWNEDDEKTISKIIEIFHYVEETSTIGPISLYSKEINWLKSLKDRVQLK